MVRKFYIKTFSWEYWPLWLVYFPVSFYFLYLSIKARSFFFFSATNPTIENGGMLFSSKWKIFQLIPKEYYPTTIFVDNDENISSIKHRMQESGIVFPVMAKPDRGERGWGVRKIENIAELEKYRKAMNITFLVQSYINYPIEISVFYYRHPLANRGIVTSVTYKKLLTISGDGFSTIEKLILDNDRCFLQYDKLKLQSQIDFTKILDKGEQLELVPYGNHVLGATFLNYNHIIDEQLTATIDNISKRIDGLYYGRYDLRCKSIEDLKKGINFSILEVNGTAAEAAHIYEPGYSFFKAQIEIAKHFKMMYEAAIENKKKGNEYISFHTFRNILTLEKQYRQHANIA
jgi:hypothetical protein